MILVVDDESGVRRFVRSILERAGHEVVEAPAGEEALGILRDVAREPDLLLTDIVMPGMNGLALAAQAHKIIPGLHVLFMSGFAQDYTDELTGSVCVAKPFTAAQLISAVRSALSL